MYNFAIYNLQFIRFRLHSAWLIGFAELRVVHCKLSNGT